MEIAGGHDIPRQGTSGGGRNAVSKWPLGIPRQVAFCDGRHQGPEVRDDDGAGALRPSTQDQDGQEVLGGLPTQKLGVPERAARRRQVRQRLLPRVLRQRVAQRKTRSSPPQLLRHVALGQQGESQHRLIPSPLHLIVSYHFHLFFIQLAIPQKRTGCFRFFLTGPED